jgi:hypothetical protein
MRLRWQWILPVTGLLLFFAQSYESNKHREQKGFYRDVYWSTIRLSSHPAGTKSLSAAQNDDSCDNDGQNCVVWDPDYHRRPGALARLLILCALPAFIVGLPIVSGLGRFGVNQIPVFFVLMPLCISAWFYLVGRFMDRRRLKKRREAPN